MTWSRHDIASIARDATEPLRNRVTELERQLAELRAEYEAHRHICPSNDGFVNRTAPPDTDERGRRDPGRQAAPPVVPSEG